MDSPADFWNKVGIAPPPYLTLEYCREEDGTTVDNLVSLLTKKLSFFCDYISSKSVQKLYRIETALLSSLIRNFQKFRKEKFFHLLKKIKKCTDRFWKLQLTDYIKRILNMMPKSSEGDRIIHLPTRQMFEHLLTLMYGAFQLLLTILTESLTVIQIILGRLGFGYFSWITVTFLAVLARIRMLSLQFARNLANFFGSIHPQLNHLKGISRFNLAEKDFYLAKELKNHMASEKSRGPPYIVQTDPLKTVPTSILDIFQDSSAFQGLLPKDSSVLPKKDLELRTEHSKMVDSESQHSDRNFEETELPDDIAIRETKDIAMDTSSIVSGLKSDKSLSFKEKREILSILDILGETEDLEEDSNKSDNKLNYNSKMTSDKESSLLPFSYARSLPSFEDLGETIDLHSSEEVEDVGREEEILSSSSGVLSKEEKFKILKKPVKLNNQVRKSKANGLSISTKKSKVKKSRNKILAASSDVIEKSSETSKDAVFSDCVLVSSPDKKNKLKKSKSVTKSAKKSKAIVVNGKKSKIKKPGIKKSTETEKHSVSLGKTESSNIKSETIECGGGITAKKVKLKKNINKYKSTSEPSIKVKSLVVNSKTVIPGDGVPVKKSKLKRIRSENSLDANANKKAKKLKKEKDNLKTFDLNE